MKKQSPRPVTAAPLEPPTGPEPEEPEAAPAQRPANPYHSRVRHGRMGDALPFPRTSEEAKAGFAIALARGIEAAKAAMAAEKAAEAQR